MPQAPQKDPYNWIVVETDYRNPKNPKIYHEVIIPDIQEAGAEAIINALNTFNSGKRKNARALDLKYSRGGCNWGPKKLYRMHKKEIWIPETQADFKSFQKVIPDAKNPLEEPRVQHQSLYDFFQHIGYNPSKRIYTDKEGKPINYSVLALGDKQKKTTKENPPPGME